MQQYSGWAPKEFDEAALDAGAAASGAAAAGTAQQQGVGAPAAGGGGAAHQQDQQQQRPAPDPSTFVYDPNTGDQGMTV
jgi:hypothetical protein